MKTALGLALLIFTVSCVPSSKTEEVSSGAANKNAPYVWGSYYSAKSVQISENFSAAESTAITEMSTAWKTAVNKTWFDHSSGTTSEKSLTISSLNQLYDSVMGIYKTTDWHDALPSTALAVTQIFGRRYNTGTSSEFVEIEHADILVNYDNFDFYTGTKSGYEYDLRTVILHEMGHFLGLQHKTSGSNSVMVPSVGHATVNRAPKSIDASDLETKYNLGSTANPAAARVLAQTYQKQSDGSPVSILIELHASGECIHKEDGVVVERHPHNQEN